MSKKYLQDEDKAPNVGAGLVKRALLAMFLVVAMSGTALATTVVLEVDDLVDSFKKEGRVEVDIPEITRAKAGGARTILLLGSDARYEDKKLGLKPRSDTMLLVRADPDRDAIAVMSIPRDLAVDVPGHGSGKKINSAFEEGGARLTVKTIKKLFEDATGEPFPINNVISVEFSSFRKAVDYIGGVYVDIDRDYFNDNSGGGERYAAIDVDAGYQKLKGRDALDYVRYRHTDNDFIRAARQQDFLRQARSQAGVKRLFQFGKRKKLINAFSRYFTVDRSFAKGKEIFSMVRLALYLVQRSPGVNGAAALLLFIGSVHALSLRRARLRRREGGAQGFGIGRNCGHAAKFIGSSRRAFQGSRLVSVTARRHGISRALLTTWRRAHREGRLCLDDMPSFAPVIVAPDTAADAAGTVWPAT